MSPGSVPIAVRKFGEDDRAEWEVHTCSEGGCGKANLKFPVGESALDDLPLLWRQISRMERNAALCVVAKLIGFYPVFTDSWVKAKNF